jgi:prolyl oligopeptidase
MQITFARTLATLGLALSSIWVAAQTAPVSPAATTPAAAAPTSPALPVARIAPVTDTYFGTQVSDPYRYMEDIKAPEVAAWMKAHSDDTARTLQALPLRGAFLADLERFEKAVSSRVFDIWRAPGERYVYMKRAAGANAFKLVTRAGLQGEERILFDPDTLAKQTGKPHAINYLVVSPDGKLAAYGVSEAGSEAATAYVIDVASGRQLGEPIPRADFGAMSFTPDGRFMAYNQLAELKPGAAATEKYLNSRVWVRPVDGKNSIARPILGTGLPGITLKPEQSPAVEFTADGRWMIATIYNGVQRELQVYVAPQSALRMRTAAPIRWRLLADYADQVVNLTYRENQVFALSLRKAPRGRILRMDLLDSNPRREAWVQVQESQQVITGLTAARDGLYIEAREGNVKRLYRQAMATGAWPARAAPPKVEPVALPVAGNFALNGFESVWQAANPLLPGVQILLGGWTQARQHYLVDETGKVSNTGLQPSGSFDNPPELVATETQCRAADGALVPMSVLHRRDIKLDGTNPTILTAYAAYGMTIEPGFSANRMAWISRGGVWAFANPRGSGVYGAQWYEAGKQATKPNTWRDLIACGEQLINTKITSKANLGIVGGSAGGITVGRAMTERPDLFAAVVPQVGALDMIRMETTPNGVPNIPEFGSTATEAGFRALLAMSTYHQIKDGTPYPAVMLTHGVNDPRVEVWHTVKTAARLKAATSSGQPVLVRLDYAAGHGIGNTGAQQRNETADTLAFFARYLGMRAAQ